jgi:hypothetical protein
MLLARYHGGLATMNRKREPGVEEGSFHVLIYCTCPQYPDILISTSCILATTKFYPIFTDVERTV